MTVSGTFGSKSKSCLPFLLANLGMFTYLFVLRKINTDIVTYMSNALRYGSHSVTCKQHHICLRVSLAEIKQMIEAQKKQKQKESY